MSASSGQDEIDDIFSSLDFWWIFGITNYEYIFCVVKGDLIYIFQNQKDSNSLLLTTLLELFKDIKQACYVPASRMIPGWN